MDLKTPETSTIYYKKDRITGFAILLLAAFVFAAFNMKAQDLRSMKFEVIDEHQGLSNHWVTDLAYDSAGFVWVGTRGGLNRYDGHLFKVFKNNPSDKNSLPVDDGQKLYTDRAGNLWVSFQNGDLSLYKPECQCFESILKGKNHFGKIKDKEFGVKYVGNDGTIWISGEGLGFYLLNQEKGRMKHYNLPWIKHEFSSTDKIENNTLHAVFEQNPGEYWLATQNGLYYFIPSTGKLYLQHFSNAAEINRLKIDYHGIIPEGKSGLWLSTFESGVHYFNFKDKCVKPFLFETRKTGYYNLVYEMVRKDEDEIWLTSGDRGLGILNTRTGQIQFNNQLLDNKEGNILFVEDILTLPSGIIILSDENAVLKYNPYANVFQFNPLKIEESQHGQLFSISKILEDPKKDRVIFATEFGNGLNILNNKTGKLKSYDIEVDLNRDFRKRIRGLLFDDQGILWVMTRDYIYYFDEKKDKLVRIEHSFSGSTMTDSELMQFWKHSDGEMLIHAKSGLIYWLDSPNKRIGGTLSIKDDLKKDLTGINRALSDANGNLWLVVDNTLGVADFDKGFWTFKPAANLAFDPVPDFKSWTADQIGNIWISVYEKGVLRLKKETDGTIKSKIFGQKEGLADLRSFAIGADQKNGIWLATLSGVEYLESNSGVFKLFGPSVGMDKFSVSFRFMQAGNDAFYITVPGKYCKVDFNAIRKSSAPALIYMDALKVFNKTRYRWFDHKTKYVIRPGEDFFSFEFGSIDLTDQSHQKFSYKLEGWDKEWINAGNRRFAGYTNLNEGDYLFKVKVANAEGQWSRALSIPIEIQTHFYNKKWFSVLLAILISFLIFLLYLYRIKNISETEKLKTEMNRQVAESRMEALRAQMNPHFIFNSLNSINRYIIKNDAKTSSLYLTRFAKLMRLVLDNSKHKLIPLSAELEALKLYIELEVFRFENKFDFNIKIDDDLDTENIEVPPLIIQPYVENAIWHGLLNKEDKGLLTIEVKKEDRLLIIQITDNGIGREKAMAIKGENNQTRKSHGLKLTDERLQSLDDKQRNKVEINDLFNPDGTSNGTQVKIRIGLD